MRKKSQRSLSLVECITSALEHNLDIAIERYNPVIAEANRRIVYADYDPTLSLRAGYNYTEDPGGFDPVAGAFPNRINTTESFQASLAGLLPTGMRYTIGAFASDAYGSSSTPLSVGTNTIFVSRPFENTRAQVLVGELRQPLLRNFWADGTRLNLKLRSKDLRIADLNLRLRIINTVSSVELAYYDLMAARENVKSAEIAFRLARKLYDENKRWGPWLSSTSGSRGPDGKQRGGGPRGTTVGGLLRKRPQEPSDGQLRGVALGGDRADRGTGGAARGSRCADGLEPGLRPASRPAGRWWWTW